MARYRKLPRRSKLAGRPVRPVRARVRRPAGSKVPRAARAPKPKVTASTRRERRLRKEGQPFLRAAQNRYGRKQRKRHGYNLRPGESEGSGWRRYSSQRARARTAPRPPSVQMRGQGQQSIMQPGGPGSVATDFTPSFAGLPPAPPPPPPMGPKSGMLGADMLPELGPKTGVPGADPSQLVSGPYVPRPPLPPETGAMGGGTYLDDGSQPTYEELLRWYLMMSSRGAMVGGQMGV